MENIKADCGSVCTPILGYQTRVKILDEKYQSRLRFTVYSNISVEDWYYGDSGRDI